ncbi:MAG TPA: hypothetical protein VGB55_11470 [Tepidisphaeraceae bacterium]|jgi:hypothetical protein
MTTLRPALLLALFGLIAAGFFWVTDPSLGLAPRVMNPSLNPIDAANQAWPGTVVGLVGSAVIVLTGLWLMIRRPA